MKAVLVVDVEEYGDYYADVYRKDADDRFEGRYYLKPLPKKLKLRVQREWLGDYDRYEIGYNACLEDMTGETE